jgi:hypothetical protein
VNDTVKTLVLNSVSDLVTNFIYYDRKDDSELTSDMLFDAIDMNIISLDEIIDHFSSELRRRLG